MKVDVTLFGHELEVDFTGTRALPATRYEPAEGPEFDIHEVVMLRGKRRRKLNVVAMTDKWGRELDDLILERLTGR